MLIDLTRCIGCDACTVACKQENGTPMDTFFARVLNVEAGTYPNVKRVYIPVLCNHCENPACLKACPNKAIIRRPDGIVLVDQDRCRGTGACVSACPYGNIILSERDQWYLDKGEAYEEKFVKPRLNTGVARKCTYCAHRVDEGLDPACVVACPTNARIFGDLDDPGSVISRYIVDQKEQTNRSPFKLLPEAGTRPAGMYLGTMSEQVSATTETPVSRARGRGSSAGARIAVGVLILLLGLTAKFALGQEKTIEQHKAELFSSSTCAGCHGQTAMGGLGPPLAQTKLTATEFLKIVREGKGMMPATPPNVVSDEEVAALHQESVALPWDESQIPIAFKVGAMLSTKNVAILFLFVFLFALVFAIRGLAYWIPCAGLGFAKPALAKFGFGRAAWVVLRSLFVDGFLVASLWRVNKHRWFMHGLMLYGFCGLLSADILMQIYNPSRGDLPLTDPLKLLPIVSGIALMAGVFYVVYRYKRDAYIDNGLTLGRDFLFVNLLLHSVISGFLTVVINRSGAHGWVMPIYLYHLSSIALLIATAPFTRFMHVWVVPTMVSLTRLTEEMTNAGVDIGFQREPSPGRHHKSLRIAEGVIKVVSPEVASDVKLRYYP